MEVLVEVVTYRMDTSSNYGLTSGKIYVECYVGCVGFTDINRTRTCFSSNALLISGLLFHAGYPRG